MARMIPDEIPRNYRSVPERLVFDRLRDRLSSSWIVLHSLGLTIHDRKPWAELDFVLVGPPGVLCLEVKGGLVERADGVWYTTPIRGGERRRKRLDEPPFEQVGSAAAALRSYLIDQVPAVADSLVGYAVATPDCTWTARGPDLDRALVYDDQDALAPIDDFVDRVVARWRGKISELRRSEPRSLGRADKQHVVDALRSDFRLVRSIRAHVDAAAEELVRLTTEQSEIFARLSDARQVIARGGAGTGKTLLAVTEAERLAEAGNKVLLTCFSRNLASDLERRLESTDVTVSTLHSLMARVVRDTGREDQIPDVDEADRYALFYPRLTAEALAAAEGAPYDAVVVDEGQDLLSLDYLTVLDALVEGGLEAGIWRFFYDPNQNLFEAVAADALHYLRESGGFEWPLTVNCRNTAQVASQVSLLSGVRLTEVLRAEGPDVEYSFVDGIDEQRRLVSNRVRGLVHDGLQPERITLLSPRTLAKSGLAEGLLGSAPDIADISRGSLLEASPDEVRFSTIASFKGLESDVVLLIDIDDLRSPSALGSLYVGSSRARTLLGIYIDERARGQFADQARRFGERAVVGNQ